MITLPVAASCFVLFCMGIIGWRIGVWRRELSDTSNRMELLIREHIKLIQRADGQDSRILAQDARILAIFNPMNERLVAIETAPERSNPPSRKIEDIEPATSWQRQRQRAEEGQFEVASRG